MVTGKQVKKLRLGVGMSQQEMAEFLRVTVSTIYKWETGPADKIIPQKYWNSIKALQDNKGLASLKSQLMDLADRLKAKDIRELIRYAEELFPARDLKKL